MNSGIISYMRGIDCIAGERYKRTMSVLDHPGEKGRSTEIIVRDILREILPIRFSLGTGFVVSSEGSATPQQDIVVYDNIDNSPIFLDGNIGIFPIECVYGTFEVKSTLTVTNFKSTLSSIKKIRAKKKWKTYYDYKTGEDIPVQIAPRSYIVAFDCAKSKEKTPNWAEKIVKDSGTVVHGIYIFKHNVFLRMWIGREDKLLKSKTYFNGFSMLYKSCLKDFFRFRMGPMSIQPYINIDLVSEE